MDPEKEQTILSPLKGKSLNHFCKQLWTTEKVLALRKNNFLVMRKSSMFMG